MAKFGEPNSECTLRDNILKPVEYQDMSTPTFYPDILKYLHAKINVISFYVYESCFFYVYVIY